MYATNVRFIHWASLL